MLLSLLMAICSLRGMPESKPVDVAPLIVLEDSLAVADDRPMGAWTPFTEEAAQ